MIKDFQFKETMIHGLWEIQPFVAEDCRGQFVKDYSEKKFQEHKVECKIREVFYSYSHEGVLRGLHFQREKTQAKLVRCISGQVWDVVVDLRKSSPTFKQWLSFELTGDNYKELFIPYGCAHGFLALQPSLMVYKCSENFYPEYDSGIRWNDEEIAVDWPLARTGGRVILSDKDENLPKFSEFVDRYGAF